MGKPPGKQAGRVPKGAGCGASPEHRRYDPPEKLGKFCRLAACAAAGVLVGIALLVPEAAVAQTTFVSNVATTSNAYASMSRTTNFSQRFQTGTEADGYRITQVVLTSDSPPSPASLVSNIQAEITQNDNSNNPSTVIATLNVPSSVGMRAGTHGFDVSGGSVWLASNTVYHIVLRHVGMAGDGTLFKWETSATSSPDPGAAQGWSIPGPRVNIGSWRQYTTTGVSRLKFQIIGYDSSSTSLTDGGIRYQGDATTGPTLTGNLRVGHTVTVDTSSITDSGGVAAITSGLETILYSVEADKDLPSNVAALAEGVRTTRVSGTTATATLVGGQGNKMVTACYEYGDAPISTVCSRLYGPILPVDVPAEGDVTVSGTPQVDIRLSADVSTITDDLDGLTNPRWTYQWERAANNRGKNAEDISEATSFEYTPVKADQGKYLRATVGFTDDLANMETKSSGWLGAVARRANVPSQGDVEVTSETGTVQVDAELTADLSGVTDPVNGLTDPDWQYDWQRADDETGSGEATISSARGETYTPTEVDDQGKYLRVQVSGF